MANAGVSPNLPSNQPDQPVHPAAPENLASNLVDVLRHGPIFKQAPNVAVTLARAGGDVKSNTESLAAIAHARALDTAAQHLQQREVQKAQAELTAGGGLPGVSDITNIGRTAGELADRARTDISHAKDYITGNLHPESGTQFTTGALTGQAYNPSAAAGAAAAGRPQAGPAPGVATVQANVAPALSQFISPIAQQLNPLTLMGTPQHLFRTWTDIYDKHGPAAMVEAMIPSLLGAGLGFFLTRGSAGSEGGVTLAEDLTGTAFDSASNTEARASLGIGDLNQAQRTGQAFRSMVTTAAKPVTLPAGALMRAATAVGTSPTFLGANVGGILTQFEQTFKESWDRTKNGSPRGEVGSFGRLVATELANAGLPGMEKGSFAFNAVSGSLDAFTNIAIPDPLGATGRVVGQARGEGLGGALGHFYGGTVIRDPQDVDRILAQYGSARAFVKDAAGLNGGAILNKYGTVGVSPMLANLLGSANTEADVVDVLKNMSRSVELATTTGRMPLLTSYTAIKSRFADTRVGAALTVPAPTAYQAANMEFGGREFTPGDPYAVEMIMHYGRSIGETRQAMDALGSYLLETPDPRKWQVALSNMSQVAIGRQVARALRSPADAPIAEEINRAINAAAEQNFGGRGAGFVGEFGSDFNGYNLSHVFSPTDEAAQSRVAAVFFSQQGKMVMPTYRDTQKVVNSIADVVKWSSAHGVYAKGQNLRDGIDDWVNHKFFQPLALATGGWALRVSSSEILLNMLRQGPVNFSAAAIARSAAKHDLAIGLIQTDPAALADMDRLDQLMQKGIQSSTAKSYAARAGQNLTRNIVAATRGILAGTDAALLEGIGKQRYLDAATKLMILHDGMIPGAISATHNLPLVGQDEVSKKLQDINSWLRSPFADQSGRRIANLSLGNDWARIGPAMNGYFSALSAHQGLIARDALLGQPLAKAFLDHLNAGMTEEEAFAATKADAVNILNAIPNRTRNYMLRNIAKEPGSLQPTPIDDWAEKATRAIRGATKGQYGPLHAEMLRDIAENTVPPTAKDMIAKYGSKASAHHVADEELPRDIPGQLPETGHGQLLQRVASQLHTKVFSKMVNYLSREPTYIADFANELRLLEPTMLEGSVPATINDGYDNLPVRQIVDHTKAYDNIPEGKVRFFRGEHPSLPRRKTGGYGINGDNMFFTPSADYARSYGSTGRVVGEDLNSARLYAVDVDEDLLHDTFAADQLISGHTLADVKAAQAAKKDYQYVTEMDWPGTRSGGGLTPDQADVVAQTRAIFKSIRFVHNPQDRMKLEEELHVIAPFYFAKNQAIRRAGRLFATNPGAFEQYLKLNLAVQNISFQANQNNGQSYFIVPGSTIIGSQMTRLMGQLGIMPEGSIPIGLSGSTDTMQTMVPWSGNGEAAPGSPMSLEQTLLSPSLGPLGAIPVRAVQDFTTGHVHDTAAQVLGPVGSTTPWWTYFVPNSILQHVVELAAFQGDSTALGTSANTALLGMIAAVTEEGGGMTSLTQIKPSDLAKTTALAGQQIQPGTAALNTTQQAALIKRIHNGAAVLLFTRLLATGMSPVSLSLQRADLKFTQEVQQYISKAKGNITVGVDKFLRDHPDAVASSVYESTSDVGSGWGETAKDGAWMKANGALVAKYPNAAQYLVPPSDNVGPFSESTHLLQMAEGLRHENTPAEFLKNIYVASGNAWYYNGIKPQLDAALKADPGNSYSIYKRVDQIITNYGQRNPQWLEYWNAEASSTNRSQAWIQLNQILADPSVPKNAQTEHLSVLVKSYSNYASASAAAGSAAQRATLKAQWQQYLQTTATKWPDVNVAVTDLFSHL